MPVFLCDTTSMVCFICIQGKHLLCFRLWNEIADTHLSDFSCAAGESEDQQHRPEGVILLPLCPSHWNISCCSRWNLSPLSSKHCPVSRGSSSSPTVPGWTVCIKQHSAIMSRADQPRHSFRIVTNDNHNTGLFQCPHTEYQPNFPLNFFFTLAITTIIYCITKI